MQDSKSCEKISVPESTENWQCCCYQFEKYSDLVIHIENFHLKYINGSQNKTKKNVYKYTCECNNQFFEYTIHSRTFLKKAHPKYFDLQSLQQEIWNF